MTFAAALAYLTHALATTGEQLLWLLGPLLLCALALHVVSGLIQRRAALLCGPSIHLWLTFPGVVVHELGHAFFCLLFGHRIVELSLLRPGSDGVLGYVKHSWERGSLYQNVGNFFIGTGPIWFGTALIALALHALPGPSLFATLWQSLPPLPVDAAPQLWLTPFSEALLAALKSLFTAERLGDGRFWLVLYLIFVIGSHIRLSPADLKGSLAGLVTGASVLLLVNLATLWANLNLTALLQPCAPYAFTVATALLLILICNLAVALLILLLSAGRN